MMISISMLMPMIASVGLSKYTCRSVPNFLHQILLLLILTTWTNGDVCATQLQIKTTDSCAGFDNSDGQTKEDVYIEFEIAGKWESRLFHDGHPTSATGTLESKVFKKVTYTDLPGRPTRLRLRMVDNGDGIDDAWCFSTVKIKSPTSTTCGSGVWCPLSTMYRSHTTKQELLIIDLGSFLQVHAFGCVAPPSVSTSSAPSLSTTMPSTPPSFSPTTVSDSPSSLPSQSPFPLSSPPSISSSSPSPSPSNTPSFSTTTSSSSSSPGSPSPIFTSTSTTSKLSISSSSSYSPSNHIPVSNPPSSSPVRSRMSPPDFPSSPPTDSLTNVPSRSPATANPSFIPVAPPSFLPTPTSVEFLPSITMCVERDSPVCGNQPCLNVSVGLICVCEAGTAWLVNDASFVCNFTERKAVCEYNPCTTNSKCALNSWSEFGFQCTTEISISSPDLTPTTKSVTATSEIASSSDDTAKATTIPVWVIGLVVGLVVLVLLVLFFWVKRVRRKQLGPQLQLQSSRTGLSTNPVYQSAMSTFSAVHVSPNFECESSDSDISDPQVSNDWDARDTITNSAYATLDDTKAGTTNSHKWEAREAITNSTYATINDTAVDNQNHSWGNRETIANGTYETPNEAHVDSDQDISFQTDEFMEELELEI
eukprot:m.14576 g.14576  ORF g.14576 m.14576 type:complete len:648 (-) comp10208_c0_seq1:97-2040(-)